MTAPETECDIKEQLQQQLFELEMLQSIYAKPGEVELYDPNVICEIQDYIDDKRDTLPSRLDYTISLNLEDKNVRLCVCVSLPHDYPAASAADIHVRSEDLGRGAHRDINDSLQKYIDEISEGGMSSVLTVLQWLENSEDIKCTAASASPAAASVSSAASAATDSVTEKFVRLWIYSHHIYSKYKRKDILDLAGELHLTGFSLPGKPGLMCVEGTSCNTDEFWAKIRAMTWKKIVIRYKEEEPVAGGDDLERCRRFTGFQEQAFEAWQGSGRNYHMDMGKFYTYLEDHDSSYMFPIYFGGIEGKSARDRAL